MKAIPIHQAKAHLSEYIAAAKAGKPVYIGSFGNAEVVLTAVPKVSAQPLWGSMKGKVSISDAEWDETDEQIAADFNISLDRD